MPKACASFILASLLLLVGCGGSNSSNSASGSAGGAALSQYQAALPDGSIMQLEILADDDRSWEGEFAVAAETGPYAFQVGTFEGLVTGGAVNATAVLTDGTTFQLTGVAHGDSGLQLTRSDIPGVVLNFTKVVPTGPQASAVVSFNLNTGSTSGGTTGRVTLSDQPFSTNISMTEYRGSWLGCNVTFWAYSNGYASIVIYVNDFAIETVNVTSYKLSDFSSATKSASSVSGNIYNPTSKTIIKFAGTASVSP